MASNNYTRASGNAADRVEKELLEILRRDPDHRIPFDGKFRFFSERYGYELKAVDLRYNSDRGELVLVGASRWNSSDGDTPLDTDNAVHFHVRSGVDGASSLTVVEVPFNEVFNDLQKNPSVIEKNGRRTVFDGSYLLSKSRRAVISKYLEKPFETLRPLARRGTLEFSDFMPGSEMKSAAGRLVSSVSASPEGRLTFKSIDGIPFDLSSMSLGEIVRLGESLEYGRQLFRSALHDFSVVKSEVENPGGMTHSVSDTDARLGEQAGLSSIYAKYPLRVAHGVAVQMCRFYQSVFSDFCHSRAEIDLMMRNYRLTGKGFGSFKRSKTFE